jgi:hypothetical protein
LTVYKIAEEDGILKTICQGILTESLGMHHVASQLLSCVSKESVDCAKADENLLKNTVTSDES